MRGGRRYAARLRATTETEAVGSYDDPGGPSRRTMTAVPDQHLRAAGGVSGSEAEDAHALFDPDACLAGCLHERGVEARAGEREAMDPFGEPACHDSVRAPDPPTFQAGGSERGHSVEQSLARQRLDSARVQAFAARLGAWEPPPVEEGHVPAPGGQEAGHRGAGADRPRPRGCHSTQSWLSF